MTKDEITAETVGHRTQTQILHSFVVLRLFNCKQIFVFHWLYVKFNYTYHVLSVRPINFSVPPPPFFVIRYSCNRTAASNVTKHETNINMNWMRCIRSNLCDQIKCNCNQWAECMRYVRLIWFNLTTKTLHYFAFVYLNLAS